MSSKGRVSPDSDSFQTEMDDAEDVIRADGDPMEWVSKLKHELIDDYIWSEVLREQNSGVADSINEGANELETAEDELNEIKNGGETGGGMLYDELTELGVKLSNGSTEEAFEQSTFDNMIEASDGLGIDYVLRGGKRLRPAMTLLTEYGLEGEITDKGLLIGAAQEIIHASSLAQDDEMDGDKVRRNKLSTERLNKALFEDKGYDQSMLDGNKVEAWAGKAVLAAVGKGVPQETAQEAFTIEADLQDGQKRDIEMESAELRETELEDYEDMIEGKTGALYSGGVEIMVETHLENENYSNRDQCNLDNDDVQSLFTEYMDSFNKLFQAGDDMIEIFNSDDVEKSTSDIENRKITFPALNTKYGLENVDNSYAGIFLDVFDRKYDQIANQNGEVSSEVRQTASEMGVEIPSEAQVGGDWENQWITDVIHEYGHTPSKEKADQYIQRAEDAIDRLQENNVLEDEIADKYREMAGFVYNRDT